VPTYPAPTDPVSALTRADGTTEAHSSDHGRVIEVWENVKSYGALGDGATDDTTAIQAALTAAGAGSSVRKRVYFPKGVYFLAEGSTLTVPTLVTISGSGKHQTNISTKNAYAWTLSADDVRIEHMSTTLRSGSTTGGAIKVVDASGVYVYRVQGQGLSGVTEPVFHINGGIGVFLDLIQASASATGVKFDTGTSFNNYNFLRGATITSCTKGVHIAGGTSQWIEGCDIESCTSYAIHIDTTNGTVIRDSWLEQNGDHNILIANSNSCHITGNAFHAQSGATGNHITITRSLSAQRDAHYIHGNVFQATGAAGVRVVLGSNVEDTVLAFNRGISSDFLTDSGTRTVLMQPDTNGTDVSWRMPGPIQMAESTAPATPAANRIALYLADNGSGTSLVAKYEDGTTTTVARKGMNILSGTGSPENVYSAAVGSLFLRTDGSGSTTLYVKESGSGNTGWVAK
jgi:hypothetical protein